MIKFIRFSGKKDEDINDSLVFSKELGVVSFRRSRIKDVNGHWKIICIDRKGKLRGFIICTNQRLRMEVHELLTREII